ncbi:MAG TPA: excinuclease ABC subunit UvrC, partial [Atribacteraceae bacterium]|nr:excinuclease ABC subunit UvrC [Atribacteraceae bacterium]
KARYARHEVAREDIGSLPAACGVYLFKNRKAEVIYVGKAINIVKRVKSHLSRSPSVFRRNLADEIHSVATILTHNEHEALLLEEELIKNYRPRYNLRLRDDKSYPYLCFSRDGKFPAVSFTRRKTAKNGLFFGPYTDSRKTREGLKILRSIFQIRGCKHPENRFPLVRPCLDHEVGLCSAPCVGKVTEDVYQENLWDAHAFLRGEFKNVEERLERDMWASAKDLDFEKAVYFRGRLEAVRKIMIRYRLVLEEAADVDFIEGGFWEGLAGVTVVKIRRGCLVGSENYLVTLEGQPEHHDLIQEFLESFYSDVDFVPPRLVVAVQNQDDLRQNASELSFPLNVTLPRDDRERDLLTLARENIKKTLEGERRRILLKEMAGEELLIRTRDVLVLPMLPRLVDAVDISTFQGDETVGVVVSFQEGRPAKKRYRKFILKGGEAPDDYAAIDAVLVRYFRQLQCQNRDLPDFLLVDGGEGQLSAARQAMNKVGVQIPAAALAKGFEEIHLLSGSSPLRLPDHSEVLRFLQRVRDEAHRFALGFHRLRRNKRGFEGILDGIPGVGPVRKKRLLTAFNNLGDLLEVTPQEASQTLRIPQQVIDEIRIRLRSRFADK